MVSKTLKKKAPARQAKPTFAAPVVNSAKDLLFAGLGVFSVAQKEGEKLFGQGTKLFDRLVAEGARYEKKSIQSAEKAVKGIRTDVEKSFEGITRQVNENWDSLGNVFDGRVSDTLERLGIPTSNELEKLSGHVKDMSAKAASNWKGLEKVARDVADNLGKLEKEFTKRVELALDNLHVPSMEDVNKLAENLRKLSREYTDNLGKLETTVEKRVSSVVGKLEATTDAEIKKLNANLKDVSGQVSDNMGKLEKVVEERVKVALGGLGLPGKDDFAKLSRELDRLSNKVGELEKNLKASAKSTQARSVKKPAAKSTGGMTAEERKKAAEAISKMKPAPKPETPAG